MIKTLLKKQILSIMHSMFRRNSRKKSSSGQKGTVAYIFLMLYLAGFFAWMFYGFCKTLCSPLVSAGLDWLYFAYVSLFAVALSIIGSIFLVKASLYDAKDNELILSLPIPPKIILLCRTIPLYLENLIFGAIILVPSYIVYAQTVPFGVTTVVSWVVQLFLIPLFSFAICSIFGYITALISAKMRHKNIIEIVFLFAFFVVYMFLTMQANSLLASIIANSGSISEKIKVWLFFFYETGLGMTGKVLPLVFSCLVSLVLMGLVYIVLSRSYIRIMTTKRGAKKKAYKEKTVKALSSDRALFGKELRYLISKPIYMFNGTTGSLMILLGIIVLISERGRIAGAVNASPYFMETAAIICALIIALVAGMNSVTAPSISLEGKNFWITRSLPISSWQILKSKLMLHMAVTAPFSIIASVVGGIILHVSAITFIILAAYPLFLVFIVACSGLLFNLKWANFTWESESEPIKQSLPIILSLICGIMIPILTALIGYLLMNSIAPIYYMEFVTVILLAACIVLRNMIKIKGSAMLEKL